jgi:repressor LexA
MKVTYQKYAELRDQRGMSDYRVSKETGIAQSTMSDWKNGLSTPKADKLMLIAKALDVRMEDLFEEVTV